MGELVVGRPALKLNYVVSLPLDMVSVMSLLYRAVPGSGLATWLVAARRALSEESRDDLDVLHGFSGRLLYYMEEPVMRFEPLRPDRLDATFDDVVAFLELLPAEEYREMVWHALERVHTDLGTGMLRPDEASEAACRSFIEPALTTATSDLVLALLAEPDTLKRRTIRLMRGVWEQGYADEFSRRLPQLHEASVLATGTAGFGFALAFVEMTGNRIPSTLITGANDVESVTFCPSFHLGSFVSYTVYPPQLIVFFDAAAFIERIRPKAASNGHAASPDPAPETVETDILLEGLRALGDPNRLRVIDLLSTGELYAQEIVGRLGIAQSAVSRHLSLLERAGLVKVRPRGGMKYYALDCVRLMSIGDSLRCRAKEI
ncbi:MAG: ArsR/SmtB family transcription factor [Thermomicrobiales bacterium]